MNPQGHFEALLGSGFNPFLWFVLGDEFVTFTVRSEPFVGPLLPDLAEMSKRLQPLSGMPAAGERESNLFALAWLKRPADGESVVLAEASGFAVQRGEHSAGG